MYRLVKQFPDREVHYSPFDTREIFSKEAKRKEKKTIPMRFFSSSFHYFLDLLSKQNEACGKPVHTFSLLVKKFIHLFLYVDGVQDTLTQNMAPWHVEYYKLKETEKRAEAGRPH